MMCKMQKYLAGALVLAIVFFGFVIVRVGIAKPSTKFELAKIPDDQKLHAAAYKDAYPLQYNSFMRNNEAAPSPTGYGGSMPHVSARELQGLQIRGAIRCGARTHVRGRGLRDVASSAAAEGLVHHV